MTKLYLVVLALAAFTASLNAIEEPNISIVKPALVKIRVQDTGSRLLSQEEASKLKQDEIAVAKLVKPIAEVDPKTLVDPAIVKPVEIQPAQKIEKPSELTDNKQLIDNGGLLPPIPLQFPQLPIPSFVQSILNSLPQFGGQSNDLSNDMVSQSSDNQPPRKIISILLMKHMNPSSNEANPEEATNPIKSSFFIFKFMPKFGKDEDKPILGGDSDPDSKIKSILGGNTDPDMKMKPMHLLGGGGEHDPDHMRFKMNPIFTGNDDLAINKLNTNDDDSDDDSDDDDDDDNNSKPEESNVISISSLFDRVRNFLRSQQFSASDVPPPPQSIVIRTDDGQTAVLPNDFGFSGHVKQADEQNKCLMLSFMRLKASMYYRTILHLLFFSGVLLFVLFMILLWIKSYKKRKYTTLRYYPHDMTVSTIDGADSSDVKSNKVKFLRTWSDSESQLITSPDVKSILINAPPSYDQTPYNKDVDTKSLPPDYEDEQPAPVEKSNIDPKA